MAKLSYRDRWARHVAQRKLEQNFEQLRKKLSASIPNILGIPDIAGLVDAVVDSQAPLNKVGLKPQTQGQLKIGIVGAGAAGLFTGLIFDWLNTSLKSEGFNISYEIHEASTQEGGRLFTYRFPQQSATDVNNYYDVGAMRFPQNDIMDRTFRLFKYLGSAIKLDSYELSDPNQPTRYNDVQGFGPPSSSKTDPYNVNADLTQEGQDKVDPIVWTTDSDTIMKNALSAFMGTAKNSIDDGNWALMMQADAMSTRSFLSSTTNPSPVPAGPGYNYNTTEWLETVTLGTGWFDEALTETTLEMMDFTADPSQWFRVDQGAQNIATGMMKMLQGGQPNFQRKVYALTSATKNPNAQQPYTIHWFDTSGKTPVPQSNTYDAVFNSTTLACLQRMNLTNAGLLYGAKQAIRALGYGASCKVAIQFKNAWWTQWKIAGGQGKTDLPLRTCVYPSFAVSAENPAVLLCSYTWGQDAQRIASLFNSQDPTAGEELKYTLIDNLARLHTSTEDDYQALKAFLWVDGQYIQHHAWDWYHQSNTSGAFAYFGPSQFSQMWPEIIKPQAYNQLYLIGEATSSRHAWVVGALESAVRAVYTMLNALSLADPTYKPYQDAMNLLSTENQSEGYPFYPLPAEMPAVPAPAGPPGAPAPPKEGKEEPMSYTAAQVSIAHLESFVDALDEENS